MVDCSGTQEKALHTPRSADELPDGWWWSRLDDLCKGVFDCPHSTPRLSDAGPLLVRTQDILTGVFRTEQAAHVSDETYRERTARAVPTYGDLLYSREGTYFGIAAEVPENTLVCLGQRMVLIRPRGDQVHFRYLRYWLNSPVMSAYLHGFRDGSVAERLNLPTIRALPILVPPLPEQRTIAHVLGTLDDKIELNRQMNQTLEQIAAALFKSWFVDFDPVRTKAEGRQPEGMDAVTAALFPDRFVESEIGEIPEGWHAAGLDKIANYLNGLALQKYPPNGNESLPVIKIAQLRKGNTEGADRASAQLDPGYIVEDGDVLFSWSGSLEVELWTGGRGALNQHLFKVTSEKYPKWFYFLWTRHYLPWFQELARAKATTMGHIQRRHLTEAKVVVPATQTLVTSDKVIGPLFEAIINNSLQSRTLSTLRDLLLPRLLSGEISVGSGYDQASKAYQEGSQAFPAEESQLAYAVD